MITLEKTFDLDQNGLVLLNKHNAEISVDSINYDTKDRRFYNDNAKSLSEYTAEELSTIIMYISTVNHTRSPKESAVALAEYIYQNKADFIKKLQNGDISLVDELLNVKTPRREKSLVSKICSYLCQYEFNEFHFVIIDSIVCEVLPYYLKCYGVDERSLKKSKTKKIANCSYSEVYSMLSALRNELPEKLSLYEIDQILWYFYSQNNVKREIVKKL